MSSECPACRRPLEADAVFCSHCGRSVEGMAERARRAAERRRRPWLVGGVLAALLAAVAPLLLRVGTGSSARETVRDRAGVVLALEEGDWAQALRLVSPSGDVPADPESRRLWAEAWHERCLAEGPEAYARAARARELSLADAPRDAAGLRARAELESGFGLRARAAAWWEAALQAADDPARAELLHDTAVAVALSGASGRAELLLEERLERIPGDARARALRGLLHLGAGRLGLAEADLLAALKEEPELVAARAGLVETLRRQGRSDAARAELRVLGERRRESVTALEAAAFLAQEQGSEEEAAAARAAAAALAAGG